MNDEHQTRQFHDESPCDLTRLIQAYFDITDNPRIGTVSKIEVPIQDVGEYELVLTLKLKK